MLISPTEPSRLKSLGKVSSKPERYGVDFLIIGHRGKKVGVQRKKFPEDLIASLLDDRIYHQLQKAGGLDHLVYVLEGMGEWTRDGNLMYYSHFTRAQLHGLILSLSFIHDCQVFQVRDMDETIDLLENLERWSMKKKHQSLSSRGSAKPDSWGNVGLKEVGVHFLQSFPGVGPTLALNIWEHFGGVPFSWDVGVEELMEVKGIGKGKAESLWGVLGGKDKENGGDNG